MNYDNLVIFNNFMNKYIGDKKTNIKNNTMPNTQGQASTKLDTQFGKPIGQVVQQNKPYQMMGNSTVLPYSQQGYPTLDKTANQFSGGIL